MIQRIVKRFILNQQRESSNINDSGFDDLKQDLQLVRFEMLNNANNIKKLKDEMLRYISILHCDMSTIGDKILHNMNYEGIKFELNAPIQDGGSKKNSKK